MSRTRRLLLTTALASLGAFATAGSVAAYDGNAAATWADNNAINANCEISPCFQNDCASFVSQSMHFGGGYPFYGVGQNTHDDHYWWLNEAFGGWSYSDSWPGVPHLYNFELWHIPGGTDYGSVIPGMAHPTSSGLSKGDLVFYDWTNNNSLDHVSMRVATGTDPTYTTWIGDLVDAHTNTRYHAYWTLAPYNAYALTTKIQRVHIYATN